MTRGLEKRINRVLMWAAWLSISLIKIAISLVRPTHAIVSFKIKLEEDQTVGWFHRGRKLTGELPGNLIFLPLARATSARFPIPSIYKFMCI